MCVVCQATHGSDARLRYAEFPYSLVRITMTIAPSSSQSSFEPGSLAVVGGEEPSALAQNAAPATRHSSNSEAPGRLREKLNQLAPNPSLSGQRTTTAPAQPAPRTAASQCASQTTAYASPVATPTSTNPRSAIATPSVAAAPTVAPTVAPSVAQATADQQSIESVIRDRTKQLRKRRIMIVDDEETNILMVQAFLQQNGYQHFIPVEDPRDALPLIDRQKPDVVLLDLKMPHINGLEILKRLARDSKTERLPVIVLTAASDPETKKAALDAGAMDFLTKPVDPHELIPRVRNALLIKSHLDDIEGENAKLEALVRKRTEDLTRSRQQLILSLAKAAEHRDDDTGNHVLRVGRYAGIIARELGWQEPRVQMLELAAQLHDVGKIAIPDAILFKPGKLDPQERRLIEKHCSFGKDIIEPIGEQDLQKLRAHTRLGADILHVRSSPMMLMAARIAQTHHEKWDGSGYPIGLSKEDIPIEARITAVADVFDALSSERPYKKAFPREKCFQIIIEGRGSHFDPQAVDAFLARSNDIVQVQMDLMDRQSR